MADMKRQTWFKDVKSSSEGGYPQAQLEVNRVKAESYGLSVTDITRMLNQTKTRRYCHNETGGRCSLYRNL